MLMATLVRYHRKAIKLDDLPRFTLFVKAVSAANPATAPRRAAEQPASGYYDYADAAPADGSSPLDADVSAQLV